MSSRFHFAQCVAEEKMELLIIDTHFIGIPYVTPAALELSQILSLRLWAAIDQSVQRLAVSLTVRGSNLGGRRDFPLSSRPAPVPTSLLYKCVPGLSQG